MQFSLLPYRGLICLSGEEKNTFLQGLVSNDVMHLTKASIVYAALLSPQGKFLHDFFLIDWSDNIVIDCEKGRIADLVRRLTSYRLRSKVKIEAMPDSMGIAAIWGQDEKLPDTQMDNMRLLPDPRLGELGWRAVGDIAAIETWCHGQGMTPSDAIAYDRMRLEAGVPDGSKDLVVDKSTILPFGFEQLHGVDFAKGCYVGQEVTARTKHIGQVRKFVHKVIAANGVLPAPGTPIILDGEQVGTLCSHEDGIGLALVTLSLMEKAESTHSNFICGDVILKVELPAWAK